jgi:hypothetical protein
LQFPSDYKTLEKEIERSWEINVAQIKEQAHNILSEQDSIITLFVQLERLVEGDFSLN